MCFPEAFRLRPRAVLFCTHIGSMHPSSLYPGLPAAAPVCLQSFFFAGFSFARDPLQAGPCCCRFITSTSQLLLPWAATAALVCLQRKPSSRVAHCQVEAQVFAGGGRDRHQGRCRRGGRPARLPHPACQRLGRDPELGGDESVRGLGSVSGKDRRGRAQHDTPVYSRTCHGGFFLTI